MTAGALALAAEIAANAAPAVAGVKHILNYMQDHSVRDGLNYVAAWNSAFLSVEEIQKALTAMLETKKP
jgi:enoyl-CoA hydratase